jgi:hypothetical protein
MKIEINNRRKIFVIQKEFNKYFPKLELEFHERPNTKVGPASKKLIKDKSKALAHCRSVHNSGFITILPEMTVGELKQNFCDVFGLTVEIFQKSQIKPEKYITANKGIILEELNK